MYRMIYPILSPVCNGPITQFFGENYQTYHDKLGLNGHNGIDYGVPVGTEIRAGASGWVREALHDAEGFGWYVKVMHSWGHSVYGHLSKLLVKKGDEVKEGQVLGLSGNSGWSTGPHLHLGVRVDPYDRNDGWQGYVNPLPLLQHPKTGGALAVHWIPTHKDGDDYTVFKRWQPASIKIFENGWTNPDLLTWLYKELPNTLMVWRDWPLSEQKDDMINQPEATGQRHAEEWIGKFKGMVAQGAVVDRARTAFTGINEPPVWSNLDETVRYNVAFMNGLMAQGHRAGALNISVGWPGNTGTDTPPNWEPYEAMHMPLKRGGHYLIPHEYWDIAGPQENWGWWGGRIFACPWNVPIIIGECGIDRHVNPAGYDGQRGWHGHMEADQYYAQLRQYEDAITKDSRIHSLQTFTYDTGAPNWNSFDVRPALRWKFAEYGEQMRGKPRAWVGATPPPVEPPIEPPQPPSNDLEERVALLEAQMMDLREALIGWAE
jgi:hypothetical protein